MLHYSLSTPKRQSKIQGKDIILPAQHKNFSPTFANAAVEQDPPGEPHGTRQVEGVLLSVVVLGQLEAAEGAEAVQEIEDQGHHVDRQRHQDPQRVLKRLQEWVQFRLSGSLWEREKMFNTQMFIFWVQI